MSIKDRQFIERTNELIVDLRKDLMQILVDDAGKDVKNEDFEKWAEYRLEWVSKWLNKGEDFQQKNITMTFDENGININFK